MYSNFNIEHIEAIHAMGLAVVCDGDRLWFTTVTDKSSQDAEAEYEGYERRLKEWN